MPTLRKILFFFSAVGKKKTTLLLFTSLSMGFLELLNIGLLAPFVSILANPTLLHSNKHLRSAYDWSGAADDRSFLIRLGIVIILTLLLKNAYTALVKSLNFKITWNAQHSIARILLNSYVSRDYDYFTKTDSALLLRNVSAVTGALVNGVIAPTISLVTDFLILLTTLSMLLVVDWKITLAVGLILAISVFVIQFSLRKIISRLGELKDKSSAEIFYLLSQTFQGIKDVKILNKEEHFKAEFEKASINHTRAEIAYSTLGSLPSLIIEFIGISLIVLLVLLMLSQGTAIQSILPLISFFVLAAYRLLPAASRVAPSLYSIRFYSFAMNIVYDELKSNLEMDHFKPADTDTLTHRETAGLPFKAKIEIKDVSFRYENTSRDVLNQVTLDIPLRSSTAFVGASGSGKTTFADVLMLLLKYNSGTITVDGVPLTDENAANWRKNIGYIPQQIYLCDDTLAANIAFGVARDQMDSERLANAIRMAQLEGVVKNLPEGTRTLIGERGVRLSGGQRQRIGIARALYHDPELIIMDEATSALDNLTEGEIVSELKTLSKQKTLIIIAHRLSTVRDCDIIHLMDQGKIIVSGNYEQLLAQSEAFRRLARERS